ncbi:transmembrane channel-like protein 7 isoform X2 [Dysidea avara]|uniref:transmembrane channel-like protein 7 isoform X2 n=1 Tax=Dysidea avara TaxID=196820 RepID=UPI00332D688A
MAEKVKHSIRAVVELDEAVDFADLPNSIQSPSQSKKIQERLKKREELREKFKEAFDEVTDEQLGVVHRAVQVGPSQIKNNPNTLPLSNEIHELLGQPNKNQARQVAKKANQVESLFRKPSFIKMEQSVKQNVHRINPSDENKLYEDAQEDPTLSWVVPTDLYQGNTDGNSRFNGYVNQKSHFGWLQLLLYNLRISWKRYSSHNSDRIPLLRAQIKQIEGNFGVGIASFFVFTRLVITLNIVLAVLWTTFVILPGVITYDSSEVITKGLKEEILGEEEEFHVRHLFDGRGAVADSILFYGGYVRESFCNYDDVDGTREYDSCSYRIDIAYMVMIFLSIFGPFFVISWSYSESLGSSRGNNNEDILAPFSVMILTSWDHSLISREAVSNLSKGITNTLKDKLTEFRNAEKKKILTRKDKAKLVLRRFAAWFMAFLLVAVATGGIVLSIVFGADIRSETDGKGFLVETIGEFLELYGTSVLFVVINALVPTLMGFLLLIEKYDSGKTEFNVTITRVFTVRILNLYALMAGWKIATEDCDLEDVVCAGTYYGQELYKVTILGCAATIIGQLILRLGYFYWFNKKKEFLISDAVLAVVYIQSVVWAGTPMCPFLPLIAVVGFLCLFFAYYYIVQYTCHPPIKRWSQSRKNSFFLFSLLAALVCVIIPVSISVQTDQVLLSSVVYSNDTEDYCNHDLFCGPFRDRNAIEAILPDESSDSCGTLCNIFYLLYSSAIGLPLIFCLIIALFQCSLRLNHARKKHSALLRELAAERQNMREAKKAYAHLQFDLQQARDQQQTTTLGTLDHSPTRGSF